MNRNIYSFTSRNKSKRGEQIFKNRSLYVDLSDYPSSPRISSAGYKLAPCVFAHQRLIRCLEIGLNCSRSPVLIALFCLSLMLPSLLALQSALSSSFFCFVVWGSFCLCVNLVLLRDLSCVHLFADFPTFICTGYGFFSSRLFNFKQNLAAMPPSHSWSCQ